MSEPADKDHTPWTLEDYHRGLQRRTEQANENFYGSWTLEDYRLALWEFVSSQSKRTEERRKLLESIAENGEKMAKVTASEPRFADRHRHEAAIAREILEHAFPAPAVS